MIETLLVAGGAALAAPWWTHHRQRQGAPQATGKAPVGEVEQRWRASVAAEGHALPRSAISYVGDFEHGRTYRVQLVPGKQSLATAHAALPLISSGLRMPVDELVLELHPEVGGKRDPSLLQLQVITTSPIKETVWFDAPRFDHGMIHLGPYADGLGDAVWRLYTTDSMWGGFVLGGIGSGKSRLVEIIALTARAMGNTVIVYVDGQDGASSSTLWRHANLRAGARDATKVLASAELIMADRARFNVEHGLDGFTPSPGRPGILVIVDECHAIFPQNGERWANAARTWRKVGGAVLGADQYSDLKVFAGLEPLRSSLLAGNGVALRTMSRMAKHLIPGLALDPYDLPVLPGYGYIVAAPGSGARTAPFRARHLMSASDKAAAPDAPVLSVAEWFERVPVVPFDPAAQHQVDVVEMAAETAVKRRAGMSTDAAVDAVVAERYRQAQPASPVDEEATGATMADRLLGLVAERGRMTLAEIYGAVPGASTRTVRYALKTLVERGNLTRSAEGVYELP